MAYCSSCGGELVADVRFCPKCGRDVSAAGATQPGTGPGATASQLSSNLVGLLCYVAGLVTGILFLILEPYKRDPFVRFHAFQSIFFCIAAMVISIVVGAIPFVGWILAPFVGLGIVVLWVVLMVQAYQNKKWKLPVLGDLAEKQG